MFPLAWCLVGEAVTLREGTSRKISGKALLSYQELATALTRIEAVINSIEAVHDRK